ncbi:MAG: SLC13 family permease [Spirochaetes bacterium]|nr:SLC13 family permease [Spirochaetota bacterium]
MASAALIIFITTYIGIIFTRLPGINVDRPSAAFFGAVAMILFGVVSMEDAVLAIDFNTIFLLLGMMIIISVLELDGFFTLIARTTITFSSNTSQLLTLVVFTTGIASAFLVNDAVVLLFTPVILRICRSGNLNPIPYLFAEIMASNIGSAMTITGNPQNILIGINSGIPYGWFLLHLLPVSLLGMVALVFIIRRFFRTEFKTGRNITFNGDGFEYHYASMKVSVPIFLLVILLFFLSPLLDIPIPVIALLGASLVLLFGRIRPSKVIKQVDWVLLVFFAGLFIVVDGVERTGFLQPIIDHAPLSSDIAGLGILHGLGLVLSQIVSNVPYTIVMLPIMKAAGSELLWLALASSATLAGNATIIGAMANLIVIESARDEGITVGFWPFLKVGIVVTLASFIISIAVLYAEYTLAIIAR